MNFLIIFCHVAVWSVDPIYHWSFRLPIQVICLFTIKNRKIVILFDDTEFAKNFIFQDHLVLKEFKVTLFFQ